MDKKMQEELEKRYEKQNEKVAHVLWTIALSMITAIITILAYTGALK